MLKNAFIHVLILTRYSCKSRAIVAIICEKKLVSYFSMNCTRYELIYALHIRNCYVGGIIHHPRNLIS